MDFNFSLEAATQSLEKLEKQAYPVDTRFFKLTKDKNGNGGALIRFLPSEIFENGTMTTLKVVYRYDIRSKVSKRFISEWAPCTIGAEDPIQSHWANLWNSGNKDEARRFSRVTRYLANIKVINDPGNPENNGKIFLLDMSKTLGEKIKSILNPTETEKAMGIKAKNLFNPLEGGYNFMLVSSLAPTGFITYDNSKVAEEPSAIYATKEAAIADIASNCYKLSDWDKPEAYKSASELRDLLNSIDNPQSGETEVQATELTSATVQPQVQTQPQTQEQKMGSLDDLMASLAK